MFHIRSYAKDYELIEKKNGKKEAVYVGDWFVSTAGQEMTKRLRRIFPTMAVLMFFVFLGLGFIGNAGNRNLFNALAYAFSCLPVVYNIMGMVGYLRLPEKAKRAEVDQSLRRMLHSATGIAILMGIALVSEIVSLFMIKNDIFLFVEIMYFFLCIIQILSAILVHFLCKKYPYRKLNV